MQEIKNRLRPMNLRIVSNETGLSYRKVWYLVNGNAQSVKQCDAVKLAQWLERQK